MLAALVVGIGLLTGRSGPADRYATVYRNVTDIGFGTMVLYEGYPVGQVEKVTPQPAGTGMEFLVKFSVRRGWRIPADSVATVVSPRMLAPLAIEIRGGTSEASLQPGDTIKGVPGQNMFAAMGALADRLSAVDFSRLNPLLTSLDETVGGVRQMVLSDGKVASTQLAELLSSANRALPPLLAELDRSARSLSATIGDARLIVGPENRGKVERILSNVDGTSEELQRTTVEIRRLIKHVSMLVDRSGGDVQQSTSDVRYTLSLLARDMDTIMQNLEATSRNIQEFSRQIRSNPAVLIRGTRVEDEAAKP
jgi:phospholipid/cholesterol/gamma-HCH transport system substrate-binding protein